MGMRSHSEIWPEGFRECTKCLGIKPHSEFHKHKKCKGGFNSVCKVCRLPVSKRQYEGVSIELKIWGRAKRRARLNNIPFNIAVEDIIVPDVCPIFLKPFVLGDTNWSASLDKLLPELGYTKGNVFVISNRANRLKNDFTLDEFERIKKYMEERKTC